MSGPSVIPPHQIKRAAQPQCPQASTVRARPQLRHWLIISCCRLNAHLDMKCQVGHASWTSWPHVGNDDETWPHDCSAYPVQWVVQFQTAKAKQSITRGLGKWQLCGHMFDINYSSASSKMVHTVP